jgi:hypothetical protein
MPSFHAFSYVRGLACQSILNAMYYGEDVFWKDKEEPVGAAYG